MSTSTYKLVISDDEGHTTVVPLLRDEVTIGREKGNTIRLTERNVSRAHARLLRRNGAIVIEDLGSYNGVSVNGRRIESTEKLAAGDQVEIGDYGLTLQSDSTPRTTRPPPRTSSHPPPRLVLLGEPAPGAEFTLGRPALRIGRDERLDIWINHKSISHEHAEVQVEDGKVSLFDLDSANGTRVNGVRASRAVLETGDVVQLGDVRFRFLPAEGSHSLIPLAEDMQEAPPASREARKPVVALGIIAALLVLGAGAVLVTLRSGAPDAPPPVATPKAVEKKPAPTRASAPLRREPTPALEREIPLVEEPQEWERELSRARKALARGRHDRAYSIADELPEDSVLRETPEFREIRYRYVQSHINDGERALEEGDWESAAAEAALVLEVPGSTPKQRQEARRLARKAKALQGRRIVD